MLFVVRFALSCVLACSLLVVGGCGGEAKDATVTSSSSIAQTEPAAAPAIDGEKLYNRYCFSCHAAGIANAPKFGDVEAWGPRLAKGRDLLLASVKDGMPPGMPAKGLCIGCSDEELAVVTDYMLEAVSAP